MSFAKVSVHEENPWFTEFEFINCMSCRRSIPGTLGYRYGEECKNYDDAKKMSQPHRTMSLDSTTAPQKVKQFGKVGRNKPCPCGSGLKYKKCHGR